jgi:hypothetical protein
MRDTKTELTKTELTETGLTETELTVEELNQVGVPTSGGGGLWYTEVAPAWLPWALGWVRNH